MSNPTPIPREWLLLLAVLALAAFAVGGPFLPQAPAYHDFADQQHWRGLPHPGDVLSNLPFALGGIACLLALHRARRALSAGCS